MIFWCRLFRMDWYSVFVCLNVVLVFNSMMNLFLFMWVVMLFGFIFVDIILDIKIRI